MDFLTISPRPSLRAITVLAIVLHTAAAQEQLITRAEYAEAWRAAKDYTMAVAEAMPAEGYSFTPTPDQFSFAVQMIHIAHANYAWFTKVLGEPRTIEEPKSEEKPEVLRYLGETFDHCIAAIERMTPEQLSKPAAGVPNRPSGSTRDALLNMYMHTAHHRGQAIVYLRLKGVTPPQYRY